MSVFYEVAELRETHGDIYETSEKVAKALKDTDYRIMQDRNTGRMVVVVEDDE